MGRHLCIKVFIEDPENEEVNITTLSSEDGNVKTVTINSRFIHSCLEEIQKNKSNESPNFIIPPVLINKTDSNLDLETETILCNNNKTETYLKEDRDKIPKLNENCEGGSFQDVQHIKNDKYQLQEKDSIGSKTLDVSYSIRKKIVSRNEIESNSMSNRKDKIISSPVLSKDEHIYNNNDDVSNESTVRSDVSTGSYISNPIDSIKNVKYNVDDFLSEVNKQKSFEKKYGSSFMSDALYDVETQIEYSNNDTESCDQIMEEYYVVDGVIGSRYNSKIKKEEFLLKLKRCIAKNEPWNLIVDPATCPNLPIFEYGRLFIATPDSVKHMEHFEGNVLCDKFLSENSVLQDENLMDSVDLKKSEEVIPNFENETDSIRENSDFGLDLEMCDTGTNFKDTVFPELAEKLPEVADGIINNTNIAHLHIRRKRINVDNVTSAMTGLSSTGRCQVRRKSIHKLGSTFNASNRKKIEFEKLKKTLNKKIICGRTKLFNETCKSNEPLREVALKSLQNVVGISDSNELIMNNNSYQPQKLTKKNVIESDIDGFSKKVNCKQLRTPVRKKRKLKSATVPEFSQKFEKRNVQDKCNVIEVGDTSYTRKKSENLPKIIENVLVNKSTTSVNIEPSKNVLKSVQTFTLLKCSYCDYKTKRENVFQNHVRNHTAEKLICALCTDGFRTNTVSRNHKRVHSFSKESLSKNQTTIENMNTDFVKVSRKIRERNNNLQSSSMLIKKDNPTVLKKSSPSTMMVVDSDHLTVTCDIKLSQKESAEKLTHMSSTCAELYEKANSKMKSTLKLVTKNQNKGTKSSKKFVTCSACKQLFQRGYGFIVHSKQHAENDLAIHSKKRSYTEGQFENKYPIVKLQRLV